MPLPAGPWSAQVPEITDPERRVYVRQIAAAMDERKERIGQHAAQHSLPWAVNALGPVPGDQPGRAAWRRRAASIGAWRELSGHDDPADPIGPEPASGDPDIRAAWHEALAALGPVDGPDVRGMTDGMLAHLRDTYPIQTAWAPTWTGDELRFLGGRPPYGYLIADAGPHPNPAKAADGKRLHKLGTDPGAMPVVVRIFAEFTAGHGFYAIAEGLARDGIPCPSAHDPARNRHRCGIAWNKHAVRAILTNPRYTGHQVWNKQRKDEVLIDVDDVALGHTTKLRWNESGSWVWSGQIVHPPIIDRQTYDQVQAMISGHAAAPAGHKPHRRQHPYALRGCLWCGLCGRRMHSHWVNGAPYYRCRFPAEYALANRVEHPLNVNLREDAVIGHVDQWLAIELAPHRLAGTLCDLAQAQHAATITPAGEDEEPARKIADCDRKLAQYRAALDAGASPATVATWIAETEADKARHQLAARPAPARTRMSEAEFFLDAAGGAR